MGFIIFFPYSQRRKAPLQVTTSNTFVEQAWQEFTMLRYVKARHISCRKLTAPWIDQAQTYYLDSIRSNWRSAGLLYYYSFLNLAKALLVGKRKFTYKSLDSTAIHHGLSAALQDISSLANYQIQIYPPLLHGRNNVFSNFYEVVTGSIWAYQDAITIKLQHILGYCEDISIESQNLFNIARKAIDVQSLHREIGNTAWFEMVIHKSKTEVVKAELSNWDLQFLGFDQINHHDR
ncbi:MAG: YaaC family protein, partial [Anaerolineales bacterium]